MGREVLKDAQEEGKGARRPRAFTRVPQSAVKLILSARGLFGGLGLNIGRRQWQDPYAWTRVGSRQGPRALSGHIPWRRDPVSAESNEPSSLAALRGPSTSGAQQRGHPEFLAETRAQEAEAHDLSSGRQTRSASLGQSGVQHIVRQRLGWRPHGAMRA